MFLSGQVKLREQENRWASAYRGVSVYIGPTGFFLQYVYDCELREKRKQSKSQNAVPAHLLEVLLIRSAALNGSP